MGLADPAFRAIFEDAPIGIVVVDKDLKVVDINAAYCEMLGYTEAEMMSRSIPEVTHPQDRQRDIEFMPLLLSGQLPRYTTEKRYITKKGAVIWARINVTPLLEQTREIRYVFSMAQNLTEGRALRRLLPVCSSCRRVRDPQGDWSDLETYLRTRADAEVKPELCPDCARTTQEE